LRRAAEAPDVGQPTAVMPLGVHLIHMPWRDVSLGEGPFISTSVTVQEARRAGRFR
jgi:hypothetical protein